MCINRLPESKPQVHVTVSHFQRWRTGDSCGPSRDPMQRPLGRLAGDPHGQLTPAHPRVGPRRQGALGGSQIRSGMNEGWPRCIPRHVVLQFIVFVDQAGNDLFGKDVSQTYLDPESRQYRCNEMEGKKKETCTSTL